MDGSRTGGDVDQAQRFAPPEPVATPVADLTPEQEAVLANIELKAVGVVRRAMIDPDDAKDIVQETMFRMWKRLEANPRLWSEDAEDDRDGLLFTICAALIADLRGYGQTMRERDPEEEVDVDSLPSGQLSPLDQMIRMEFFSALAWALNTLAHNARRIWCLKHLERFKIDEIAVEVGVAPSSISPSLFKSNLALRDLMRADGHVWPPESES